MPTATPHVRIRCVMLFLCTVLAFAEPALRAAMNTTIVATGLEPFGITLKAPNSPDFDARVRAIVPHWVNQALQLKPYVAVLSNTSARTVVAYALSFKCTRSDGTSDVALVQFKYP